MRKIMKRIYTFDELSDVAKEKAIEAHRFDFCDAWSRENWIVTAMNFWKMELIINEKL